MSNILEFKRKPVPEAEKPVVATTKAPRPTERRITGAEIEQGILNRIETGHFSGLLPTVEPEMPPIEAFIAACQFYAMGGQDNGRNAKAALTKFHQMIQGSRPQPPQDAA